MTSKACKNQVKKAVDRILNEMTLKYDTGLDQKTILLSYLVLDYSGVSTL